jgi:hypothetical protein
MKARIRALSLGTIALAVTGGLFPAASAMAAASPAATSVLASECGALRDIPSEWTVYNGDNPCSGWGFSYILTSPSSIHYATWSWASTGGIIATSGYYTVRAWIPSEDAGANTEYDAQYCGVSGWTEIGTINQETASGWTSVSGKVPLNDSVPLCAIREHNIGSGTWYLAEDALEILNS